MDCIHSTTKSHKKGKHLTFEERVIIQIRLKDGASPSAIAEEIGCAPNTVRNEIKRGTVKLYTGKVLRYKAKAGQKAYMEHRTASCRHYDICRKSHFISYVEEKFHREGWSLDACVGRALREGLFQKEDMVCTKTLYNYVDLGLLEIRNIDLPLKLRRSHRKHKERENRKILGRSIEERPSEATDRTVFGHWEADLVLGSKSKGDSAILSLLERKTREYLMIRVPGRDPDGVMRALDGLRSQYKEHWDEVFKSITTDNGAEFSKLSEEEKLSKTLVYFAHPYSAWEKGSIECHNGLIMRFIPKGKSMDSICDDQIIQTELWCNGLPRKILGYRSPEELFDEELDRIYSMAS